MDEKIIGEIVQKVFGKAKKEHASHSRFALSKHVSDKTGLSSKTLERAYDRYLSSKIKHGAPHAESVDLLCTYLGYQDYADYINKSLVHEKEVRNNQKPKNNGEGGDEKKKRIALISITIVVGAILSTILIQGKWRPKGPNKANTEHCMTWADSSYIKISCDKTPYSEKGTTVEPYKDHLFKNLKKVKVSAAYTFFNEEGQSLIWYYKNKDDQIEYFTAPGLHPVTGKTLKEITPYIIQKYVPKHSYNSDSYMETSNE